MPTQTLAPAHSPLAPTNPRFVRTYRATGYCRPAVGHLARGRVGGVDAHLTLPIERVIAVDARTRMGGGPLNVTVVGPDPLAGSALAGAHALAEAHNLRGDIRLTVRSATGGLGVGECEAAAAAAIAAISKAEELGVSAPARAALLAGAGLGELGLTHGIPGLVSRDGRLLHAVHEHGRLMVVVIAPARAAGRPAGGGAGTAPDVGELTVPSGDLRSAATFTAWLEDVVGCGDSQVQQIAAQVVGSQRSDARIIGGRDAQDPVLALLPGGPDAMRPAKEVSEAIRAAVGHMGTAQSWTVTLALTAAPSAAL